ncbi:MAG: DUF4169 family protein [Pseudomonadota bacterium]
MVEPINLNKARKAKARADKEQRAQENRIKFGRTKSEKARDTHLQAKTKTDFDGKKRD